MFPSHDPRGERYARIFRHLAQTQLPQYKQFVRVYDSATGKPDRNGDVISVPKQLAGIFGFRMIKVKPERALNFYITDFIKGEENSRKEFTGGQEGVLRPGKNSRDIIERYFVANKIYFLLNN